jgi:hypothetical protein
MIKNTRFKNNFLANKTIYSMFNKRFLFLLCIACTFVLLTPLASLAQIPVFNPIAAKSDLSITQITQSLTALIVVSAFLERAIEIVFRLKFLSKIKDEKKQQWTQIIRFVAGLFISIIGIRGLAPLFNDITDPSQKTLFGFVDTVMTGIIISEGSGGVHNILTSLTAFLDVTEKESKQKIEKIGIPTGDGSNPATTTVTPAG